MSERESILQSLEPLFKHAEREGLWFRSKYQGLWFSPSELRREHKNGRFVWGPVNWGLLPPEVRLESMDREKARIEDERAKFAARMEKDAGK